MTEGLRGPVCQPSDVTCRPDVFACGSCLLNIVTAKCPGREAWKPRVKFQLSFLPAV